MEKTEINAGLTTLLLAGIIAGVAITTIVIKNATSKILHRHLQRHRNLRHLLLRDPVL
ncbi:MAG: hypothetical protein IPH77_14835 [Ignavibacteria bacterium]|nr:hypothetical protein [Ignavibacteria bacterium]